MIITESMLEPLGYGSLILGAGGGGSMRKGVQGAREALAAGPIELKTVDEFAADATVVTISGVGSPASKTSHVEGKDYLRAVELLEQKSDCRVGALIASEIGGSSSFGPFHCAAMKKLPILDAPCNGRAHPLGTMGSLGLAESNAQTTHAACGGNAAESRYVEMVASGTVAQAASLVLSSAIQAGGVVAVARNPMPASYIRTHAAVGAYAQALKIGEAYLAGAAASAKIRNVADAIEGTIVAEGAVSDYRLETRNGLDVGSFSLSGTAKAITAYIWNEYMALDIDGGRAFTFPDFMMTFDARTGLPFTSAEIEEGRPCVLVAAPRANLILGAGMREASGYRAIEAALGIEMLRYCGDLLQ